MNDTAIGFIESHVLIKENKRLARHTHDHTFGVSELELGTYSFGLISASAP
jgi:hypothetical protein